MHNYLCISCDILLDRDWLPSCITNLCHIILVEHLHHIPGNDLLLTKIIVSHFPDIMLPDPSLLAPLSVICFPKLFRLIYIKLTKLTYVSGQPMTIVLFLKINVTEKNYATLGIEITTMAPTA